MNYVEIIGYVASVLVAISLTMSQILKLRVLNFIGCAIFSVYGYLLGAFPIFLVNGFIALINVYYLIKMYRNKDAFDVFNASSNPEYLSMFFEHFKNDIKVFFPKFNEDDLKTKKSIFILRNMRPVNLVVFDEQEDGIIEILLDYAIPEYRDSLNGKYFLSLFVKDKTDMNQFVAKSESKDHIKYLKKIGFKKNDAGLFVNKF